MFIDFSLCSANDLSDPKHHRSCHVLVCHKWVSVLAIFHLATLLFFPLYSYMLAMLCVQKSFPASPVHAAYAQCMRSFFHFCFTLPVFCVTLFDGLLRCCQTEMLTHSKSSSNEGLSSFVL